MKLISMKNGMIHTLGPWITNVRDNTTRAFCRFCNSDFSVAITVEIQVKESAGRTKHIEKATTILNSKSSLWATSDSFVLKSSANVHVSVGNVPVSVEDAPVSIKDVAISVKDKDIPVSIQLLTSTSNCHLDSQAYQIFRCTLNLGRK